MCWNADISLQTFIVGVISAIIVIALNKVEYKYILLGISISLMQLIEYYAWKNINNKQIIKLLSIFGALLIVIQLLIINISLLKGKERLIILILLFLGLLATLVFIINNDKFKMEKGNNGHLIWYWIDIPKPVLIYILFFYLYAFFRSKNTLYVGIIVIILLILSLYNFYKHKTWGSMWCYYSNIIWMILIFNSIFQIKTYKKKNLNYIKK